MSFSEWKEYKLGDLTKWRSGGTPPKMVEKYWNGSIPWISAKTLIGNSISTSSIKITNEGLIKGSRLAEIGSILLLVRGSGLFKGFPVAIVEKEVAFNQDIKEIIADRNFLLPEFLLYWIEANTQTLNNKLEVTGIGAGKFDTEILKGLDIQIPSFNIQKIIIDFFKTIDDKIEFNRQTNKTLEAIAQTLFKEMCVPKRTETSMGWKTVVFSNLFEVKDGTHNSPKQKPEGKHLITSKHLMKEGFIDFDSAYKISVADYTDINKRSQVDNFDILYSMIGTIGNIHLVNENEVDFAIKNIGLFKTSQRKDLIYLVYLFLKSEFAIQYMKERHSGSTQQYVTLKTLREIPINIPPETTIIKLNKQVIPLFEQIKINNQQILTLIILRDSLLPKLMKGEIKL